MDNPSYADLDNAAGAALYHLTAEMAEKLGALYKADAGYKFSDTVTSGDTKHAKGRLTIPAGSLAALFHNHPLLPKESKRVSEGELFSEDDINTAHRLGVPSYIVTPSNSIRKYDPATKKVTEVLAELPLDQIRSKQIKALDLVPPNNTGIIGANK